MEFIKTYTYVLLFFLAQASSGQPIEKVIDSIANQKKQQYEIPGLALGVVRNGQIIFQKGYGVKSINEERKVTETSIFHTASVSKLFTALAVIQLQGKKKLSVNDLLVDLVPDLQYSDSRIEQISIKQLLNHTSGLPDVRIYHWNYNHKSENTLKEYVNELNLELKTAPGEEYNYSNLGYNILGYVIEIVSEQSFEDFVKNNILNPAGMKSSDFRYFIIADSLKTYPHSKKRMTGKVYERNIYPYTREHAASSTLNTSAADLANWMIWFMNELQTHKNYQQLILPSIENYAYMGLGYQLGEISGLKKAGHYGGDKGYRSYLVMVPEKNVGVALLANCDYNEDFRQEIVNPILKLILEDE